MSQKAQRVIVATDDLRIFSAVKKFNGNVVMTSQEHNTGTDRIIEVAKKNPADIFINVQGDEPLIRPADIDRLIDKMQCDSTCDVATLCHPMPEQEAINPNVVKVVRSANGKALYFSRRLIPYISESQQARTYQKHIGVYGYRNHILAQYKNLPFSQLENQERLEQLRLLEAGIPIDVLETSRAGQGVDTPEDLEKVKQVLLRQLDYAESRQHAILL